MTRWPGAMHAGPMRAASTCCRTVKSPASTSKAAKSSVCRPARGAIRAGKVGIVVADRSGQVAAMAGMRLPVESHILQAFVTEGLKPCIDHVVSFGMGHFSISQSDKGGLVFGGDLDGYASYAQRGNLPRAEHIMEAAMTLMPMIGKARVVRSWGGIMDMTPGRLADHRQDRDRRLVHQLRLVLRRIQGNSRLRRRIRASDRNRRTA